MKSVDNTFLKKREDRWNQKYEELLHWQNAYLDQEKINGQEVSADMLILMQIQLLDELKADMRDLINEFSNYLLQVPAPKQQSFEEVLEAVKEQQHEK